MKKFLKRTASQIVWRLFSFLDVKIELASGIKASLQQHADIKMLQEVFCEQGYREFLDKISAPINTWIDLGANCGLFSLYLEDYARKKGWSGPRRGALVEPNRYALASLHRSLQLSGLQESFAVFEGVVADKSKTYSFYESKVAYRNSVFATRRHRLRSVPVISLDQLIAGLGGPVDLIKIDIEGAEKIVFENWLPALVTARHIIVEWHQPHYGCRDIDKALAPHGYQRCVTQLGFGVEPPGGDIAEANMGVGLWSRI